MDREIWRGSGLEVQYLGSHALHLDRNYYNNTPLPGPGLVNSRRPHPLFNVIRTIQNDAIANYQALSVTVRQRMTRGIQFRASYTWAHTLDGVADSNGGGSPMNPYNSRQDYGNANWDIRHRLTGGLVYDVPFFAARNPILKAAFSRWQMNALFVVQTGLPFNVGTGIDTANTSANGTHRPNLVGKPKSNCGGGHLVGCIDSSAYALPPAGVFVYRNEGRNLLHGPGLLNVDYSVFKNFPIGKKVKLQFRAEFFNVLNHPSFNNPAATFGTGIFGNITTTSTENRDIQFGLKVSF